MSDPRVSLSDEQDELRRLYAALRGYMEAKLAAGDQTTAHEIARIVHDVREGGRAAVPPTEETK